MKKPNKSYHLVFVLFFSLSLSPKVVAQVQHNFEKDPENTDCHLLKPPFESQEKGIESIESATFRFEQQMNISRYKIPNAAHFYSCDGTTGFLIVNESAEVKKLYIKVTKDIWDEFVASNDPIGFYQNKIKPLAEK